MKQRLWLEKKRKKKHIKALLIVDFKQNNIAIILYDMSSVQMYTMVNANVYSIYRLVGRKYS